MNIPTCFWTLTSLAIEREYHADASVGISFARGMACEAVLYGQTRCECEQNGRPEAPRTRQIEAQVADLKRRIPILKRLIADCDCTAADLDQEIQREEDRVRIHDRAHFAYSIYARATTWRRDNLRRSADELRAHLAEAEKALRESPIL